LYKASTVSGTDTITVIDTANGDTEATAKRVVSPLWPMAYDRMCGTEKGENLSLLRAFRNEVWADSKVGREYRKPLKLRIISVYSVQFCGAI